MLGDEIGAIFVSEGYFWKSMGLSTSVDILPIPEGRGFWDLQTLHSEERLTGSPPMADAPAIFFAASSLLL